MNTRSYTHTHTHTHILKYWGLNSGPTPWAISLALFCDGCFQDRVSWTICPGWLQPEILLISASWVARITGMSHRHLAKKLYITTYLKSPQRSCRILSVSFNEWEKLRLMRVNGSSKWQFLTNIKVHWTVERVKKKKILF
jgi:hypothetical protein